jgi:hypothetical protein
LKEDSSPPATVEIAQPLIDALPPSAFQASSIWFGDVSDHGPANARYSSTNTRSNWSTHDTDMNQWWQVDLQRINVVRAIGTKGRNKCECLFMICDLSWVTAYRIAHSVDGIRWQFVGEGEIPRLFAANSDNQTEVRHEFKMPIKARFLRVYPQSWHSGITMRIEAYGYATAL